MRRQLMLHGQLTTAGPKSGASVTLAAPPGILDQIGFPGPAILVVLMQHPPATRPETWHATGVSQPRAQVPFSSTPGS